MPMPVDTAALLAGSIYAVYSGVALLSAADGKAEATLDYRHEVTNSIGIVHGGALFTLADVAMGGAGCSLVYPQRVTVTGKADIKYIAPARSGPIHCHAVVDQRDGRYLHLSATITAAGETVATATSVLVAIEPPGNMSG